MALRDPVERHFDDVNDWLTVGGDLDLAYELSGRSFVDTVWGLRDHGITHVLDLRAEWCDKDAWVYAGLPAENHCYAPIVDWWEHAPDEGWFQVVEEFVERFWHESYEGDRLYVHCHEGVNRAPSAAMIAMLTVEPTMHPYEAFLRVREARPAAGLVYADVVGARHIAMSTELGRIDEYVQMICDYWAPETIREPSAGAVRFLDAEAGA